MPIAPGPGQPPARPAGVCMIAFGLWVVAQGLPEVLWREGGSRVRCRWSRSRGRRLCSGMGIPGQLSPAHRGVRCPPAAPGQSQHRRLYAHVDCSWSADADRSALGSRGWKVGLGKTTGVTYPVPRTWIEEDCTTHEELSPERGIASE